MKIKKVGIIGAGQMGSGIAHVCALAGFDVGVNDVSKDRIDAGLAKGLKPGVDHEATPACVNSCIAQALHFGDIEDKESNVSQLLAENQFFRMHEELGTEPGFYYLWDKKETRT